MAENMESLVLERLRHIRGRVDQIADDVSDLKHRMSGLEQSISLVKLNAVNKTAAVIRAAMVGCCIEPRDPETNPNSEIGWSLHV